MTTPLDNINALRDHLTSRLIGREGEIRALLVALVAREHVLLHGPPGTAKSLLANLLTEALDAKRFEVLLTRFSAPEDVFGPVSIKGLEQDRYERVTAGYLPTAEVAFIDEIFKANAAILNSLLTILNERAYDNGAQRLTVPLEICIAASNELPQDESLGALYDRFLVRRHVDYLTGRDQMAALLGMASTASPMPSLSRADLEALRGAADAVTVPQEVISAILDIREALQREELQVSDRRWRRCLGLVRAAAALDGCTSASLRHLWPLSDALWTTPDQRAVVYGAVTGKSNAMLLKVQTIIDAADEAMAEIDFSDKSEVSSGRQMRVVGQLKQMLAEARDIASATRDPDIDAAVAEFEALAQDFRSRVFKAQGLDL